MGITCKQATEFLSKREEGKLKLGQRVQLAGHLMVCSLCKRFETYNDSIRQLLKSSYDTSTERLPAEKKSSIIKQMVENMS